MSVKEILWDFLYFLYLLKKCDILVVGGGPAGLSAAFMAAKAGLKVTVCEKDKSIAQNIRTSGVSWLNEMKKLGIPDSFYNPIKNFKFVSPSNEITISGKNYESCVLDIRQTYQYLANLAATAGAEILINTNVLQVKKDQNKRLVGVIAKQNNILLDISCKLIIDATGFNSIIARNLGLVKKWERYGVGCEFECYCENLDIETWTLMVGKIYSPAGYAWIFPTSKNRARIGVGVAKPESQEEPFIILNHLINNKIKPLNKMGNIQPIEYHYGFIPNQGGRECSVFDNLILVGDSAGQSNPLVLEGIRHAVEFGRLAGEVGANSIEKNCSKESLIQYEKIWKKKLSSKIESSLRVQSRWLEFSDDDWDNELDIIREMSVDELLDFVKGDFSASKMVKLALNHPKIAAKQLFNLVLKR